MAALPVGTLVEVYWPGGRVGTATAGAERGADAAGVGGAEGPLGLLGGASGEAGGSVQLQGGGKQKGAGQAFEESQVHLPALDDLCRFLMFSEAFQQLTPEMRDDLGITSTRLSCSDRLTYLPTCQLLRLAHLPAGSQAASSKHTDDCKADFKRTVILHFKGAHGAKMKGKSLWAVMKEYGPESMFQTIGMFKPDL
ncbi:hypothetical protein CYMTET_42421 [Cymbomonas tetramitiformis]|uniref:Uncharacterized protein n=1 Tax=Cymbomonas tetramitiformis TaxID=36881 RepID=A0AAE0C442_9CHLO|nr:hypothetical protein CYMTET_42421 [Cymbomonas tetramitiformis]